MIVTLAGAKILIDASSAAAVVHQNWHITRPGHLITHITPDEAQHARVTISLARFIMNVNNVHCLIRRKSSNHLDFRIENLAMILHKDCIPLWGKRFKSAYRGVEIIFDRQRRPEAVLVPELGYTDQMPEYTRRASVMEQLHALRTLRVKEHLAALQYDAVHKKTDGKTNFVDVLCHG